MRLVLAVSLDGRLAPPEGGAAQLGGAGDRRALEQALAWADACLIGAGTLRAHQCTCLIRDPQLLQERRRLGRPDQPAAVLVSHQSSFPQQWRFFEQPLQRWLLAPVAPSEGFDRWLPLAESWGDQLQALGLLGVERLVLLGGLAWQVTCCSRTPSMNCNSPWCLGCWAVERLGCRESWRLCLKP